MAPWDIGRRTEYSISKVSNLEGGMSVLVAWFTQKYILHLQIPMNDAQTVQVMESVGNLLEDIL